MSRRNSLQFDKVRRVIQYMEVSFQQQPSLKELAKHVNLSPYHFQKLFTEWAGVSPKKYIQFLSVDYAKKLLAESGKSLYEAALETGLSGSSRLHDLFVSIEGMTPGEYKKGGASLCINYSFMDTHFGEVIVASTEKGVCYMAFCAMQDEGLAGLRGEFPQAQLLQKSDAIQQRVLSIFSQDWSDLEGIKLHLKGTDFQLKVWSALLQVPEGQLNSYASIAKAIDSPKASRAVGSAIGSNPVAFLIPCHRVIQSSGKISGYRWGRERKQALIAWEAARCECL